MKKSMFSNRKEMLSFKKRMQQVANRYVKKLKKENCVVSIAFSGSIVHGRISPNSDIDIICFYEPDFFKNYIEGKKEFYDIRDKSGLLVQINNVSIGRPEKNIFSELFRKSPEEWPIYKNHHLMLLPVYDPEERIAALKKEMSKIYDEEIAYLLPEYLKRVALSSATLRKFNSVSQKRFDDFRQDVLAGECIKFSIYSAYIANKRVPPYENPLFELDLFSLKKKPSSFSMLAEKSPMDYPSLALQVSDETLKMFMPVAKRFCRKVGIALPTEKDSLKLDSYSISHYAEEALFRAYEADLGIFKRRIFLKKKCLNEYYLFASRKNIYDKISRSKDEKEIAKELNNLIAILNSGLKNNFDDKNVIKKELSDVFYKKAGLSFLNIKEKIKEEEEARKIRGRITDFKIDEDWLRKEIEKNELLQYEEEIKGASPKVIAKIKKYISTLKNDLRNMHEESKCAKKSGVIDIKNVVFLKEDNTSSSAFKTGEQMTIRIDYDAYKEVKNPVFGIAFYSEDGTHLSGPNTMFSGFRIRTINGRGSIFYRIKKIPFLEGKYFITVAVHPYNSFNPYDVHVKEYSFKVVESPAEFGLLHLDSEWSI